MTFNGLLLLRYSTCANSAPLEPITSSSWRYRLRQKCSPSNL